MAKAPVLNPITAGFASASALNANFAAIEASFENTVSLDGSVPNTMGGDFDMGGNDIMNIGTIDATNISISGVDLDARVADADASATAAAASETAAAATFDNFDDIYLGAKAADPTLDNDGDALATGALYFNTGTPEMRVWNGAAWDPLSTPSGSGTVTSVGIADSGATEFTVTTSPVTTTGNITLAVATIAGTKIDLVDAAAHYTGTNVETVTAEIGVSLALLAPIDAPTFTGVPAAPTAVTTTNTTQLATTAFVQQEITALAGLTRSTAVVTTSGTDIDFTIAAGVNQITLVLRDVSIDASTDLMCRLGDSGGIKTTGYAAGAEQSGVAVEDITTGMLLTSFGTATKVYSGTVTFTRMVDDEWIYASVLTDTGDGRGFQGAGWIDVTAELTTLRLTTQTGTANFDLGKINILTQ